MPSYDFQCKSCGERFVLTYKTYRAYDEATHTCPHCGSTDLTRLISRVAIPKPSPDLANLSPSEMLSVMEGGDSREVGELFRQVGETVPGGMDAEYNSVTERLLSGDKPEQIESDLQDRAKPASDTESKSSTNTTKP